MVFDLLAREQEVDAGAPFAERRERLSLLGGATIEEAPSS